MVSTPAILLLRLVGLKLINTLFRDPRSPARAADSRTTNSILGLEVSESGQSSLRSSVYSSSYRLTSCLSSLLTACRTAMNSCERSQRAKREIAMNSPADAVIHDIWRPLRKLLCRPWELNPAHTTIRLSRILDMRRFHLSRTFPGLQVRVESRLRST
jgi:hypothetical protein